MSRQRSPDALPRFARATTSATGAIGSRTPVHECTHVTATARVFGVIARAMRATISAAFAFAPSSERVRVDLLPIELDGLCYWFGHRYEQVCREMDRVRGQRELFPYRTPIDGPVRRLERLRLRWGRAGLTRRTIATAGDALGGASNEGSDHLSPIDRRHLKTPELTLQPDWRRRRRMRSRALHG